MHLYGQPREERIFATGVLRVLTPPADICVLEKTISGLNVSPKLKVVTVSGQGGNKGAKEAAKAKPDGCTLFAIHQSAFTSHLNGRIKFHYDAFDPVALLTDTPDIIGASAKAPWNNYKDFQKGVLA